MQTMSVSWLLGLIWETTVPQIVVERENQENNTVGKVERKTKNLMDLELNCFDIGINYLIVL